MNNRKAILSTLCTQSVIKANTGRNTQLLLCANRGFLFPDAWSVHDRINYKTLCADPSRVYAERDHYRMRFAKLL